MPENSNAAGDPYKLDAEYNREIVRDGVAGGFLSDDWDLGRVLSSNIENFMDLDRIEAEGSIDIIPAIIGRRVVINVSSKPKIGSNRLIVCTEPFLVTVSARNGETKESILETLLDLRQVDHPLNSNAHHITLTSIRLSTDHLMQALRQANITRCKVKGFGEKQEVKSGVEDLRLIREADPNSIIHCDIAISIPSQFIHWGGKTHCIPLKDDGDPKYEVLTLMKLEDPSSLYQHFGSRVSVHHWPMFAFSQMYYSNFQDVPNHGSFNVTPTSGHIPRNASVGNVREVKCYGTTHHTAKAYLTYKGEKISQTYAATKYLEMLEGYTKVLGKYSAGARFEVKYRLPSQFKEDDWPTCDDGTIDYARVFKNPMFAVQKIWESTKFLLLPAKMVQLHCEMIIDYCKNLGPSSPLIARVFNSRYRKNFSIEQKEYVYMVFQNLGWASYTANQVFINSFTNPSCNLDKPFQWFFVEVWRHFAKTNGQLNTIYRWDGVESSEEDLLAGPKEVLKEWLTHSPMQIQDELGLGLELNESVVKEQWHAFNLGIDSNEPPLTFVMAGRNQPREMKILQQVGCMLFFPSNLINSRVYQLIYEDDSNISYKKFFGAKMLNVEPEEPDDEENLEHELEVDIMLTQEVLDVQLNEVEEYFQLWEHDQEFIEMNKRIYVKESNQRWMVFRKRRGIALHRSTMEEAIKAVHEKATEGHLIYANWRVTLKLKDN